MVVALTLLPDLFVEGFQAVVDMLEQLGIFVLWAVISGLNLLIEGLGAIIDVLLEVLPQMPAVPAVPTVVGMLNWVAPVGALLGILSTFVVFYITFLAVRIIGRWVKAL
jgi:hypothetical protein